MKCYFCQKEMNDDENMLNRLNPIKSGIFLLTSCLMCRNNASLILKDISKIIDETELKQGK